MNIEQYQNIVVINITHCKYTNYWVYRADAVNPEKTHGWDSLPVYLSALKQTISCPEVHKQGNGEDQHLYYIPMGNTVDIEKAKKIALNKFSSWKLPFSAMPEYVIRFLFRKKQNTPSKIEIFRKNDERAKNAFIKAYQHSVSSPYHQKENQLVIYWHGNTIRQIMEEVSALVLDCWKTPKLSNWL